VIVFLTELIRSYFNWVLSRIGMQNPFFLAFYSVLLVKNMHYTELLYHFMVEEAFDRSGETIERAVDIAQGYVNQNQIGAIKYIKLTVASVTVMILGLMPAQAQPTLNYVFAGVKSYRDKAEKERQAAYETQTETESESV
jgi:hypothetical protein